MSTPDRPVVLWIPRRTGDGGTRSPLDGERLEAEGLQLRACAGAQEALRELRRTPGVELVLWDLRDADPARIERFASTRATRRSGRPRMCALWEGADPGALAEEEGSAWDDVVVPAPPMAMARRLRRRIRRRPDTLRSAVARLRGQQEMLVRLARDPALTSGDQKRALHAVTVASAQALGVARAGVWLYSEDRDRIRCVDLYHANEACHESGAEMFAEDYPEYFAALEEGRTLAATDAVRDPRTTEFEREYLRPNGIGAMLDAPVRVGGRVVGVVCQEHVGGPRTWEPDEETFAASVADLVALTLEHTERARAERRLHESRRRLSDLLESLPHVVFYETGGGREYVSDNIVDLVGIPAEEFTSDRGTFPKLIHTDDREEVFRRVRAWHREGEPGVLVSQFRVRRSDGSYRWIEDHIVEHRPNGSPAYMAGVMIDVSDRKRIEEERETLEEQLLQAQKMEAIGNLAGGIAHDFNNLLTGILGYASLLRETADDEGSVRRSALVIEGAARRAAELTQQLLGFARKGKHREVPVDLHATVREVVELLERTIDKKIEVRCRLEAERAVVHGDPAQMSQVLLNLALNARDAMPEGGVLTISTAGGTPGDVLRLHVEDTGPGIPRELRGRIFEPFFTTKEQGQGSGMGLAMVYGIVQNHGGTIAVDGAAGAGARFELQLPLAPEREDRGEVAAPEVGQAGRGRILLVDDEDVVRRVARDILRHLGYSVVAHGDARGAVDWVRTHPGEVDLAIVDMVMPEMDGRECIRALRSAEPGLRALLSTGYSLEDTPAALAEEGVLGLAPKPYRIGELSDVVARALAS